MPILQFKCNKCGKVVEKLFLHKVGRKLDDDVDSFIAQNCPDCGGHLERIVSEPSIKFVGKDFYVNEERARRERERINNDVRLANERIDRKKWEKTNGSKSTEE